MPMYDYRCADAKCAHEFEDVRPVDHRATSRCPECSCLAHMVIRRAPALDPRMGTDPDFPTAARNFEQKHIKLATGRMKDSNNTRFGTDKDVEEDAYRARKLYDS